MKKAIVICLIALLGVSCGQRQKKTAQADDAAKAPVEFPVVSVPSYVTTEEGAVNYMAQHYWDMFDFSDTTYLAAPDVMEQAFANFIGYATAAPDREAAKTSMRNVFVKSEPYPAMYEHLRDLAEKYLDDPNSPMRNEELYIEVLEAVVANPLLDDLMKLAPRRRLKMALKNRPGHKANDFTFTTAAGRPGSLYGVKADYLVIFFYNLGCTACKEVREHMLYVFSEPNMAGALQSGRLKVLALYPDEDMTEWDKYLEDIPADWLNAYDKRQDIHDGELYDLRAIPSLYLLDKDKNVILKDFLNPEMIYHAMFQQQ